MNENYELLYKKIVKHDKNDGKAQKSNFSKAPFEKSSYFKSKGKIWYSDRTVLTEPKR